MIISAFVKIRSIRSSDVVATCLTVAETKRADTMTENTAKRFVMGRSMLRHQLAKTLNMAPQDIKLNQNENGPVTLADSDLSFSVAHSGDYVAVAVAKGGLIGVDIEDGNIIRKNWRGIAKRYFNKSEQDYIGAESELPQIQAFYRLWTAKEAVTKMEHGAIAHYLKGAEINCENGYATLIGHTPKGNKGTDIIVQHTIAKEGRMIACLAATTITAVEWDIQL